MKIVITTYNRPELKTYPLACEVAGEENVYVVFHNEKDRQQYTTAIKNPVITDAPIGMAKARNAVLSHFKPNDEIVLMDDDITQILRLSLDGKKLVLAKPQWVKQQFEKAFELCHANNTKLWGVYPVANAFFMKHRVSNKGLLIGWIMGIIVNDLRFDETFPLKTDYDYGFQNLQRYKKFVRLDYLTSNAKVGSGKGGLDFIYGTDREKEACDKLLAKWPQFVGPHPTRVNQVRLKI